jgi:hypothetical protein
MHTVIPSSCKDFCLRWSRLWLPALVLLLVGTARGEVQKQDIDIRCNPPRPRFDFDAKVGTLLDSPIGTFNNNGANVFWYFGSEATPQGCTGAPPSITCNGVTISLPAGAPSQSVSPDIPVTVYGIPTEPTPAGGAFSFKLGALLDTRERQGCERAYRLVIDRVPPNLSVITPPEPIVFGKPPNHEQAITVRNNDSVFAVGPVNFAVRCTEPPCPFVAPASIQTLDPGAEHLTKVAFSPEGLRWMTDYPATLEITVPNTSYRFEIDLSGNRRAPVITQVPAEGETLHLAPPTLQRDVVLTNQEGEKVTGLGVRLANCVGGTPCPFGYTPDTFALEPQASQEVRVRLDGKTCPGSADFEVTVPDVAIPAATVKLQGTSGEGTRMCSLDLTSELLCSQGQWQTQRCATVSGDRCANDACTCTQDGVVCASATARSECMNGRREPKWCGLNKECANNTCQCKWVRCGESCCGEDEVCCGGRCCSFCMDPNTNPVCN